MHRFGIRGGEVSRECDGGARATARRTSNPMIACRRGGDPALWAIRLS
ncbi:hypothetical protein [Methanoculleus chikugoensis]|nr:hypothetical protein [Methanoculleus chikugoensis]